MDFFMDYSCPPSPKVASTLDVVILNLVWSTIAQSRYETVSDHEYKPLHQHATIAFSSINVSSTEMYDLRLLHTVLKLFSWVS